MFINMQTGFAMHIAILVTNTDRSDFAARHPRDGEKFAALLARVRPQWQVSVWQAVDGHLPGGFDGIDGLILTGSPASVHDPDPWIGALTGLIRRAFAARVPMFGACFGHQAIALALGGRVARNPGGWVLGRVETEFEGRPLAIHAAHLEQVTVLPPGAVAVGSGPDCPVAAFAIGDRVLTTQYHPEMTRAFIAALVDEVAAKLPDGVADRARASLPGPLDDLAPRIAQVFEVARTGAA
jgi:GMP synthase-like glutamine amidotransferase